jgi:hypothetical protein
MDDPLGQMIGYLCKNKCDREQLLVILMFSFQMVKEFLNKDETACDEKDVIALGGRPILYFIPCNAQQIDDPEHCCCESAQCPGAFRELHAGPA